MDRFQRQTIIPGWNQQRLEATTVVVYGRDWVGLFVVWALAAMGIGEIRWIGAPNPWTDAMARWFLGHPCHFAGVRIEEYPFDIEYGPELEWPLEDGRVQVLVCGAEDRRARAFCRQRAVAASIPCLSGSASRGGWIGGGDPPGPPEDTQHPVAAMLVAAMLADAVRENRSPLLGGLPSPAGAFSLRTPEAPRLGPVVLIGAGGIGVYVATLAAILGLETVVMDFDRVEESNLNRQGLFTQQDAERGAYKAEAVAAALNHFFPTASVSAHVTRVTSDSVESLARLAPEAILSAVDNAATRLLLQEAGRELGARVVVQGGTSLFAADCFTQERDGPSLDEQLRGVLSLAARNEGNSAARRSGCAADPSYVVPGMICGALMVHRLAQAFQLYHGLLPIRWRAGGLPVEETQRLHVIEFPEIHAA